MIIRGLEIRIIPDNIIFLLDIVQRFLPALDLIVSIVCVNLICIAVTCLTCMSIVDTRHNIRSIIIPMPLDGHYILLQDVLFTILYIDW